MVYCILYIVHILLIAVVFGHVIVYTYITWFLEVKGIIKTPTNLGEIGCLSIFEELFVIMYEEKRWRQK